MDGTSGQLSIKTVSIHEAAQRFRVSEKTIRRWIKAGKLAASQESGPYGTAWRIPEEAIQTAQQVVDVVPVDRALDPRTLGMVIAQAVAHETQALTESIQGLQAQVEHLTQTIESLEQHRQQEAKTRDEQVVHLIRDAMERREAESKQRSWWPWKR